MEEIKELHSEKSYVSPQNKNSDNGLRLNGPSGKRLRESINLSNHFENSNSPDNHMDDSNIATGSKDKSYNSRKSKSSNSRNVRKNGRLPSH